MTTEPTRDEINRALAEWAFGGVGGIPDYCDSLDAQMPLWERAEIAAAYFEWAVVKRWIVRLERAGANAEFHADSIPEASARALYAVLEATKTAAG